MARYYFQGWRCNCTWLSVTRAEVPAVCPTHGAGVLGISGNPEFIEAADGLPLGVAPGGAP